MLGALYVTGLRGFARNQLSERLPERPGVWSKYLLPAGGFAVGAWYGFADAGAGGATVGATLGGLLAVPALVIVVWIIAQMLHGVTG